MNDLEFQRALSPDQLHEALSLLDSATGAEPRDLHVRNLGPANEVDPGADQASTTVAAQNRLPAAEDAQKHREHLNLAAAVCGLGLAATATLALLSWNEGMLLRPHHRALSGIPGEHAPNERPAQLVNSVFPTLPVTNPTSGQSSHGSERGNSKPEFAGRNPVDPENRGDDQSVKDVTSRTNAIPHEAQTVAVAAIATRQAWLDESASGKPKGVSSHTSAVRITAAKKRFWRRHSQPLTEINGGQCFLGVCLPWQKRRVFYEPPRNQIQ